ncbi:MAG: potassium channel family protein, partial [Chthoniobacterales bacterium]
ELYYFSFVTQTTLGYGDIIPIGHLARSLAISQAIIGQFYVAVVLTYILNLWIQNLGQRVDKKDTGFQPPKKHTE